MIALLSLFLVMVLSLLITRVASIALTLTGLPHQAARFQARSALTGVGFTTSESEKIVSHPVRRRIIMALMLIGKLGIASVIATLILTFANSGGVSTWGPRLALLLIGMVGILMLSHNAWVDRQLSKSISSLLRKWGKLDVRDYAGLMHLTRDYAVAELRIAPSDWLAMKNLEEAQLQAEGILVLGIQRSNGSYAGAPTGATVIQARDTLIIYGSAEAIEELDKRQAGRLGDQAHKQRVEEKERADEAHSAGKTQPRRA